MSEQPAPASKAAKRTARRAAGDDARLAALVAAAPPLSKETRDYLALLFG